jgi:acyl-CoA synthetase (AMP-forming)/AMP-acid ligase II
MIDVLLAEGALADARPRALQYGAAPIHPATLTAALAALPETRFTQIFGQTEVSPITALSHEDHLVAAAGCPSLLATVGRAIPGVELRIEAPDGDGVGEVAVQSGHAFVVDPDGWRRTGDLGRLDPEGFLALHGRLHDRIVRGGENIYPVEVERVLRAHPMVRDAAVVGVPDRRWGEVVKAVVVPSDSNVPLSEDDLRAWTREHLAHFKVPEVPAIVEVRDELPRTPSGKVLRRGL